MGHEAHLDHPGEVSWFVGHGPAPILGPCPHTECGHRSTSVVAWGPDLERYELVVCDDSTGCDGACRGWLAQPHEGHNGHGRPHHFKRFDADAEHRTTREERKAKT